MSRSLVVLCCFIALCLCVGLAGRFATATSMADWYPALVKPEWRPDDRVFGPVWTVLYLMMAVAAWLVWRKDTRFAGVRLSLLLFFVQLALNLAWSFVFFGARSIGWALVDILALWIVLVLTVWAFFGQSKWAGLLMVPYLAWVSFAAALNFSIWRLN